MSVNAGTRTIEGRTSLARRARRTAGLIALVAVCVSIAACGSSSSDGAGAGGGDSDTMELGFSGTLSGPFASYAQQMRQGAQLAVSEINAAGGIEGKQVKVTYADDRGKPENGIVIAQRFCNSDASATFGYSVSTVALAALPTFERCQMPVIGTATTSPKFTGLSRYFVRTVLSDEIVATDAAEYAIKTLGAKRVAVLYQMDDYGEGGNDSFMDAAKENGADVVYSQGYQLGTKNFLSQLTKIKDEHPDIVFLASFYPEAARIAQQAQQLGLTTRFIGLDAVLSPDLIKLAGKAADGVMAVAYFNPHVSGDTPAAKFVKAFQKRFGETPSDWSALSYDAVYALREAAKAGGGTDRKAILDGLPKVSFEGATGDLSFDDKGDRRGTPVVFEVKGGEFVVAKQQLG